jgi:hypothetical protein
MIGSSVFLPLLTPKRLTICLIIKRLWILHPLSIFTLSRYFLTLILEITKIDNTFIAMAM